MACFQTFLDALAREARREDCAPVAGKSTLNRLELTRYQGERRALSARAGEERSAHRRN